MEINKSKLSAPKPILKSNALNKTNLTLCSKTPINKSQVSNFECSLTKIHLISPKIKIFRNIIDISDNDFQKDFHELSAKSEIIGILNNSKHDTRNSYYSNSTAFSKYNLDENSQDLIFDDNERKSPPIRSKNPICDNNNFEDENNFDLIFSRSLKN